MGDMDFKAMVEAAYDQAEGGGDSGASDMEVPGAAGASAAADAGEPVGDSGVSGESTGETDTGGLVGAAQRARDEQGRFATKSKDQAAQKVAPKKTAAPSQGVAQSRPSEAAKVADVAAGASPHPAGDGSLPQGATAESIKPPQSLTPAEREHFLKAPPEVQKALARIDQTARQAMQESAPARRFQQEVSQAFEPFRQVAQQLGVQHPVQLGVQAAQVAARIATGPAHIAAQQLAQLIQSRPDVGLELINGFLQGQPPAQSQPMQLDHNAIIQQAEERVFQRLQTQRQQTLNASIQQEIAEFDADPAHEWGQDDGIRGLMSAIMANPKFKGSIKDAYQRAIWSDPETRGILLKRQAADAAKAQTASTQQALRAAASVKSTPSTGASPVKMAATHRDIVASAYDELDRG